MNVGGWRQSVSVTFTAELRSLAEALAGVRELDVDAEELPSAIAALSDPALERVLNDASDLKRCLDLVAVIAAGVAARRSSRDRGHGGLAAERGHRTPAALIQSITGGTAAEARRAVQVGEALLEGCGAGAGAGGVGAAGAGGVDAGGAGDVAAVVVPWHEPLRRARLRGVITTEQHDAIRHGLGEPPARGDEAEVADSCEVWSIAAEQLISDAASLPVEDLRRRARTLRDQLDPVGAEERLAARFDDRAFRAYRNADGAWRGTINFDDEGGMWVAAMMDAALRPRRGGPRFMTDEERTAGSALADDPRTNDQLAYDLFIDMLRAGSLASAESVFGARQPGVRMVVVKDAVGPRGQFRRMRATGHNEDGGDAIPGSVIDRAKCMNGTLDVTVDAHGNPLDVGREARLFTTTQRKALAVRDGGCMWPGCRVPASYCEAHHCDHWHEDHGRTDIDRGVLLCRFHHLLLHNNSWKITRSGQAPFVLHPPAGRGSPITLETKAPWSWVWDPPPPPDRPSWREGPARPGGGAGTEALAVTARPPGAGTVRPPTADAVAPPTAEAVASPVEGAARPPVVAAARPPVATARPPVADTVTRPAPRAARREGALVTV